MESGALTCDQIDELLSDLIEGDLPDAARAGIEAHVAACARCAAAYRSLKRTVRFVRAHAGERFKPGTPGGQYFEFVARLMQDDAEGAQRALLEGIAGITDA